MPVLTDPFRDFADRAAALDARDPLAWAKREFHHPEGLIYLDGNSLGLLPKGAEKRLRHVVRQEWGEGLISSWNTAGWFTRSLALGDRLGKLIGAAPGQVAVGDSTSVNMFKALCAALSVNPGRRVIVSETSNFPTDVYLMDAVARLYPGVSVKLAGRDGALAELIDDTTAVVALTQVDFRTGEMHDMAGVTVAAQAKGAVVIWDLAHSAGAFEVDLDGCNVDFAIGCTYKYLNAGPGGPSFIYCAARHLQLAEHPLAGWIGHDDPFSFSLDFKPAKDMRRFLCGTPVILSFAPLEVSLDIFERADMNSVRAKSVQMTTLFIDMVATFAGRHGLTLATPADPTKRGSQVSWRHAQGFAIMKALIADKVVGDFRAPDILRFGFTPLTLSHMDVVEAVRRFERIMASGAWRAQDAGRSGGLVT
jgi:kynureninase